MIIPRIEGAEQAALIWTAVKYPLLGNTKSWGGRCMGFKRQTGEHFPAENHCVQCRPMCETAKSLVDIEAILGLPTIDGIFISSTDLSLSRCRPNCYFTDEDRTDIATVAAAFAKVGKAPVLKVEDQAMLLPTTLSCPDRLGVTEDVSHNISSNPQLETDGVSFLRLTTRSELSSRPQEFKATTAKSINRKDPVIEESTSGLVEQLDRQRSATIETQKTIAS